MTPERFVVLGLAQARSTWFRTLGSWSNSGVVPIELVKCVSAAEVRARLASGRRFSAVLADAGLPSVDRDLLATARDHGCTVIVVDDRRVSRDWVALGAAAVLEEGFDREDLLAVLSAFSPSIRRGEASADELLTAPAREPSWRAPAVALLGSGGTGVSTAAIALAQALGDEHRKGHSGVPSAAYEVVLADLNLHAEQAMLHDARDLVPSIQELVEAHRGGEPSLDAVRSLAFTVEARNYRLVLGLGRARFWAAVRPEAFAAAFDSLRRAFRVVVCDIDSDLEGEDAGGSIDVEERHTMSRTVAMQADVVFPVGIPSMKGIHSMVRLICDLLALGVVRQRIVPVINRAPASPRARAGLAATLADLVAPSLPDSAVPEPLGGRRRPAQTVGVANPIFLPERSPEKALRDCARLPAGLGAPLAGAFHAVHERLAEDREKVSSTNGRSPSAQFEAVTPGSMGRWAGGAAG